MCSTCASHKTTWNSHVKYMGYFRKGQQQQQQQQRVECTFIMSSDLYLSPLRRNFTRRPRRARPVSGVVKDTRHKMESNASGTGTGRCLGLMDRDGIRTFHSLNAAACRTPANTLGSNQRAKPSDAGGIHGRESIYVHADLTYTCRKTLQRHFASKRKGS